MLGYFICNLCTCLLAMLGDELAAKGGHFKFRRVKKTNKT
jgi:hypothetical protein